MQTLLLDSFASIAFVSSLGTIVSTNPIHSVIFLILVFCNATGLLIVLTPKIEFIAIMFLIIYVGAIAVLFLFVVMMLNVRAANENWFRHFVATLAPAATLALTLESVSPIPNILQEHSLCREEDIFEYALPSLTNIQAIGYIIYTYYFYYFLMASLILLVAMIGAIVLTMHKRKNASKKQFVFKQVSRRFEDAVFFFMKKRG